MKHPLNKLALTWLLVINSSSVFPQFSYGLKGGLNYTTIREVDTKGIFSPSSANKWKASYHAGFFASYSLTNRTSVIAELLFSDKGFNNAGNESLNYLSVPLMYRVAVSKKLSFDVGAEFNMLLSANARFGVFNFNLDDKYRKTDLGMGAGANYKLTDKMLISVRYIHGLTNILKEDYGLNYSPTSNYNSSLYQSGLRFYNQTLQLSLGYQLKKSNRVENPEGSALYVPAKEKGIITTIGVRLGPSNYSMFGGEVDLRKDGGATLVDRESIELGIDLRFTIYKYVYVSAGVSHLKKGGQLKGGGWKYQAPVNLTYLSAPFVAGISLIKTKPITLSAEGGWAYNTLLSADIPYSNDLVAGYYRVENKSIVSKIYGIELATDALKKVTFFINYRKSEDMNFFHARRNTGTSENYDLWNEGYSVCLGVRLKPKLSKQDDEKL
jgi:outer membrane immunogenic protein